MFNSQTNFVKSVQERAKEPGHSAQTIILLKELQSIHIIHVSII